MSAKKRKIKIMQNIFPRHKQACAKAFYDGETTVSGSMQPSHKVRETHTFSSSQEERRTFGSRVDSLPLPSPNKSSTFLFSDSVFGMREWEREGAQLCRLALLL